VTGKEVVMKDARASDPNAFDVKRPDVKLELRRLKERNTVIFGCCLLVSAISTLANFKGIDAFNGVVGDMSLSTTMLAVLVAVTVGACVWVAWWLAAGVYPMARTPLLRLRAILQVGLTVAFVLLCSTTLNLVALVGEPSALLVMRENVRAFAEAADAPLAEGRDADAVLLALESQAAATCSCAEREGTRGSGGCITSSPGPGLVSANAAALCAMMRTGADSFRALAAETAARPGAYHEILAGLDASLRDNSLSVAERRDFYIAEAARYRSSLRDGVATGFDGRVRAIANNVRATVAGAPVAPDTAFGREQARALESLRVQGHAFAAGLESYTDDESRRGAPVPALPDPPTPIEAVFAQVQNTYPMIAVAVMVDLAMLFFIGWLSINQAAIDRLSASAPQGPFDVYLTVPPSVPDALIDQAGFVRVQWADGKSRRFGRPRRRGLFSWFKRKKEGA
jgi:hypothetical protein